MRRAFTVSRLVFGLLLAASHLGAQVGSLRVSLPSPTAASLGKFGDIPVSLYTGVPDITIPLFTAKGRMLELPIALKYHAGGIRVEEIAGWAGLGWTLEAGGVITRTVRGVVDETPGGYYNTGSTFYNPANWPVANATLITNIVDQAIDGEPDRFFFNFAGRSGEFVMGPVGTPISIESRAIPYQRLRIAPTFGGGGIPSWVVTTEDGTRYTFAAVETNVDFNQTSPGTIPAHYQESYTSSWQLTGIRSPGGDSLTLYYTPYAARHRLGTYREQFDQVSPLNCVPAQSDVINEYEVTAQRLDSIKTALHTVRFTTGAALRSDALSPTGVPQEPRLDRITVTTAAGVVLRRFQFDHDYFPGNRLRLKNVYEQDSGGVSLPPYTFTYDGQTLPATTSFAQDHWGYYNGKTTNTTLIPAGILPSGYALPGADREPDAGPMRAGALTRITYPTGGYSEFVYEGNDYGFQGGGGVTGYGPVQSKLVTSGTGGTGTFTVGGSSTVPVTVSVQQSPSDCAGQIFPPCPFTEIVGQGLWQTNAVFVLSLAPGTYTLHASDEGSGGSASIEVIWRDYGTLLKRPAGGLRVAEIRTADAMGTITTRKYIYTLQSDPTRSSGSVSYSPEYWYEYSSPACSYYSRSSMSRMPLGGGPPVGYSEVTVWNGANGEFGKTRHRFRHAGNALDDLIFEQSASVTFSKGLSLPFATPTSREWKRGQEVEATEYNGSGQVQRRRASVYAFRDEGTPDTATTRRFRGISINFFSAGGLTGAGDYVFSPFEVISAWTYLSDDTSVVYNDAGSSSFSTTRTYTYGNPKHVQLTQLTETNSNGTQRITRMKYPADYATGSGNAEATALTAMQGTANMHSPVIERWVTQKLGATETVLQATLTSFKTYATGQYLPYQAFVFNNPSGVTNFTPSLVTSGSFTKDSRYLLQETANSYDAYGRITQLTDPRSKVTNYQYSGVDAAFLTRVTRVHDATGPVDLVTDIAYDNSGFVSSIKDEGGTFRYFTYDLYGRLRQVKNNAQAVVHSYTYTYSRLSPNWTFNPAIPNAILDSTLIQTSPLAAVASTQFLDGLGRPIQTVAKDGTNYYVTATQYDAMGRQWRAWKPYTRTTAGYDASFTTNATSFYNSYLGVSNAKPYAETQYTTDELSRVKQVNPEYTGTSPTAFVTTTYGVDAAAKQQYTEVTDESGKRTRSYSDILGNTVKSILGYGAAEATTTLFTNNILGQRTQTTDPRSLITTYTLDTRGLLTTRVSPDAGSASYKYDKGGNLRYTQDANQAAAGQVYFTSYDFAGRALTSGLGSATFSTLDPDGGSPPALETTQANWLVVRAYDAKPSTAGFPWSLFSTQITPLTLSNVSGRLAATASKSNGAWQVTLFSYDGDGQIATRYTYTQANGGASVLTAVNTTAGYTRDLRGALTQRALTVGSSTFYQWYDYDNRGLFWKLFASTSSTKPGTPDVTDTYRPSGQPQTFQFQGGPLDSIRYTIRDQIARIGNPALTTYPFSARYAYRPNGSVDTAEFYSGGSPAAQKRYRYVFGSGDALNRLKSADFWSWSGSAWTSTLAYDLAGINYDVDGNITTLQRYRETATLIDNLTYAYPGTSNRLSSVTDAVAATAETWDAETGSFTYDANGNLKTAPAPYSITAVTYDPANLPLSITRSGTATGYRYDGAGQRITKQVGSGNTEVYILEGASTLGVFTVNAGGSATSWYFNLLAEGQVVGRQPNAGSRSYYYTDHLGSTRAAVQGATVVESYDFEPWGLQMSGRTLGSGTKEGFTGKEQDAETGLDYFGARYYMPALGRWSSVDPLWEKQPAWSPYNYGLNDPGFLVDPDGRKVLEGEAAQEWFRRFKATHFGMNQNALNQSGCRWHEASCLAKRLKETQGNWFKRFASRSLGEFVEDFGFAAMDETAQAAAEGNTTAKWLMAAQFVLSAIPGGSEEAGAERKVLAMGTRAEVRTALGELRLAPRVLAKVREVLGSRAAGMWGVEAVPGGGAFVYGWKPGRNTVSSAIWYWFIDARGKVVGWAKQAYNSEGLIPGTFDQLR